MLPENMRNIIEALKTKVPVEKRAEVAAKLRDRLSKIDVSGTVEGALYGALAGAVLDILPLGKVTGIDDFTAIGAAIGAYVGHRKESKKKGERQDFMAAIEEVLNEAQAKSS